jgi:hypothetical protein
MVFKGLFGFKNEIKRQVKKFPKTLRKLKLVSRRQANQGDFIINDK